MELKNITTEEIFCLKYELNTLSELILKGDAERWVFNFMFQNVEKEHLDRYNYILDYTKNKSVLDIACGSGYGSYVMATIGQAKKVVGVDLEKAAIRYGNHRFPNPNIERIEANAVEIKFKEKFDVAVSFETIEHIRDFSEFVLNLHDNLKEDGILIISTPIVKSTTRSTKNPYHIVEWSAIDFRALFNNKFKIQEVFLQNPIFELRKNTFLIKLFNKTSRIIGLGMQIKTEKRFCNIIKDEGQFNLTNCISGYQILVLEKF